MKFRGGTRVKSMWSDNFLIKRLQVQFLSKKGNISKDNQPTKNDEGAGCIYTLGFHFFLSKQTCISSNKNLCYPFFEKYFKEG